MNKLSNESKKYFTLDKTLVFLLAASAFVSLVAIALTPPFIGSALTRSYLIKQILWLVLGLITMAVLIKFGTDRLFSLVNVFYFVLMFFLVILAFGALGVFSFSFMAPVKGTHAWFQIPFLGSFQPSEFMKIVLVIKAANIMTEHNEEKTSFSWASDFHLIYKIALWALPPLFLIFLQPDTGIPIVIVMSLAIMFIVSGVRREWFIIIVSLAAFLLGSIVFLYFNNKDFLNAIFEFFSGEGSYRLRRFDAWLGYANDPGGEGYHLFNSLLAQGTAGLFGHPLGSFIRSIPEAQTDFVFAVISQNFGFFGAVTVIALVFALDIKLILITIRSNLQRERLLMIGIIGMIVFQDFQNIAMVTGILPITGITLPFISYGGSSLLSYFIPLSVAFTMSSETENEHRH